MKLTRSIAFTPKGLYSTAQGCRAAATLGGRIGGVWNLALPRPRVAAARQPWAVEYNPFGVNGLQVFPQLVGFHLPLALFPTRRGGLLPHPQERGSYSCVLQAKSWAARITLLSGTIVLLASDEMAPAEPLSARMSPASIFFRECPPCTISAPDGWVLCGIFVSPFALNAAEPLHTRIDALIAARAAGAALSPPADDAEFLHRVTLDLAGTIPSTGQARAFLQDKSPNKRVRLIDRLLAGPDYPRRLQEAFHVMLMERLGDHPEWSKYLRESFAANKPWDQLSREILRGRPRDEATRGAAFFYAKRLENYGQNPVDYPGLTRDVGRLFLGMDLRCAQCHDHLFIGDYKQADFQGLHTFFQNLYLHDAKVPAIGERVTTQKTALRRSSTRSRTRHDACRGQGNRGSRCEKGEEYLPPAEPGKKSPGVPRFSLLEQLAEQLPAATIRPSAATLPIACGGSCWRQRLVHPLDLSHSRNPPSHPELLDLLAKELVEHHFDLKWALRELALSQTYQRSSELPGSKQARGSAISDCAGKAVVGRTSAAQRAGGDRRARTHRGEKGAGSMAAIRRLSEGVRQPGPRARRRDQSVSEKRPCSSSIQRDCWLADAPTRQLVGPALAAQERGSRRGAVPERADPPADGRRAGRGGRLPKKNSNQRQKARRPADLGFAGLDRVRRKSLTG